MNAETRTCLAKSIHALLSGVEWTVDTSAQIRALYPAHGWTENGLHPDCDAESPADRETIVMLGDILNVVSSMEDPADAVAMVCTLLNANGMPVLDLPDDRPEKPNATLTAIRDVIDSQVWSADTVRTIAQMLEADGMMVRSLHSPACAHVSGEGPCDCVKAVTERAASAPYIKPYLYIKPFPVERNRYGAWHHPALPEFDDLDEEGNMAEYSHWLARQGLQDHVERHSLGRGELLSDWHPKPPTGSGWFLLKVTFDNRADRAVAVWVRRPASFSMTSKEVENKQ